MGGWIALRMAQELKKAGKSPAGIVLIAPAPDFTAELVEPSLTEAQKNDLMEQGYFEEPSEYSPNPYIYTRALIEDGRNNLVLKGIIETGCPVHILQGMQDEAVPYQHALKLVEHLPVDDVTLTLVRDGDHRLSRPQDLELLIRTVSALAERISFGD
jgi:pimeloyl-ACP methyl ester carboxylesterase